MKLELIDVSEIEPDYGRPYRAGIVAYKDLVRHIKQHGILNPITVQKLSRKTDGFRYRLVEGQARLMAMRRLKRTTVPAMVIPVPEIVLLRKENKRLRKQVKRLKEQHD